jgi:hypothetical protein
MSSGKGLRSRRWLLPGVLAVLGLGLVLLLTWRAAPQKSANTHALAPSQPAAHVEHPPDRAPAAQKPLAAVAPPVRDELCSVPAPQQLRAAGESVEQHVARLTDPAIARWRQGLLDTTNPRQRAMGLALRNARPGPVAEPQAPPDTPSDNELVLLAMETNDPAIYALALGQCGEGDPELAAGPCQGLSLEHWSRIDPDNAEPWLWIAARADAAGDHMRTDEALRRAAGATRLESYAGVMSAVALGALSPQVTPLEKAVAGADLVSVARYVTPFALVTRLCSEQAMQDSARTNQCAAIAKLLADQGSTEIEVAMAWRVGQRVGWPQDQWLALQGEQRSYMRALSYPWNAADSGGGFGCPVVKRYDFFIDQLAASGDERAALKATLEFARQAPEPRPPAGTSVSVPPEHRPL